MRRKGRETERWGRVRGKRGWGAGRGIRTEGRRKRNEE